MEFLAMLYTVLLVAICLMLALLLYRGNKPRQGGGDTEELKQWLAQQLEAQAKSFEQKQAAMAEQNYTAIRSVSETLQTAVQNMSSTLAQGQSGQQQILDPAAPEPGSGQHPEAGRAAQDPGRQHDRPAGGEHPQTG